MKFKLFFVVLFFCLFSFAWSFSQWEPLSGLPSAPIKDILTFNNRVFVVVQGVGIFVSSDYGDNWVQQNKGITTERVSSIALVDTILLVGTTDTNGVFRSTDKGFNWIQSSDSLWDRKVVMFSVDQNIVYLLTDNGTVFYSTDFGKTWWKVNTEEIESIITTIAAGKGKLLVGTAAGKIFFTENYGSTWNDISSQLISSPINSLLWDGDNIFCGTEMGLFFTSNMGKDWFPRNNGIKIPRISLIKKVNNAFVVGTRTMGILFSIDEGKTWIEFNEGIPEMNILSFGYDKYYLYAGTEYSSVSRRSLNQIKVPDVLPPVLTYPPNGAVEIDTSITFSWEESKGSISYHLIVATDNSFASDKIVIDKSGLQNTYFPATNLRPNRIYYWKVSALDYQYQEKWSEVFSFQTKLDTIPPTLLFPFNDFFVETMPLRFIWSDLGIVKNYNLQVSSTNDFQELLIDVITKDTSYATSEGIQSGNKYYWRVIVYYNDTLSFISETFSFRTGVLDVEEKIEPTIDFYLTFNQIQFLIESNEYTEVSIEIRNLFGKRVSYGWFDSTPGKFLISMNLKEHPSGFYYFSLRIGSKVFTKPFLLVK